MLQKLTIKNVALIDCVEINFTDGLNVLSGETGAGKSVIIESLNFVLGAKADKTLIRSGAEDCFVKAEFSVEPSPLISELFNEFEIEDEQLVIITRKFTIDGKNSVKINGNNVTVGMLKKLTSLLVDVHGQSEHFHLLKNSNQLGLIDRFGGVDISELKEKVKAQYQERNEIIRKLGQYGGDESSRLVKFDILNYQINEIEACDLKENEEDELLEIKNKLINQEKIGLALGSVKSSIEGDGGVGDILRTAAHSLSAVTEFAKEYDDIYNRLDSVISEISDISDTASNLLDDFDYSEYDPDKIEDRLDKIKNVKKKYGADYFEIQQFLSKAKEEREQLENYSEIADKLLISKEKTEKMLFNSYLELSNKRQKFAKEFSENVIKELRELGMTKARFEVKFSDLPENFTDCEFASSNGIDDIDFMFSANAGEPLKPMSMVISGGEMSRFMLAIKAQTAKYNEISTFIFDEIDAGISGVVAKVVSEKFAKISRDVQVIAITHLPQISAMADNNLLIEKSEDKAKTVTTVKKLSKQEKISEITRLIGGSADSEFARSHSEELIKTADKYKSLL